MWGQKAGAGVGVWPDVGLGMVQTAVDRVIEDMVRDQGELVASKM